MSITSNIANVASALTTGSLVNNLNADLLDGQTSSYFTDLSNTSSTIATAAFIKANSAFDTANNKFNSSGGTISGDVVVSGNVTVQGTTTTLNVDTLTVEDKNIVLANVASPTNTTADGAGITVLGATNKTWNWVNTNSSWTSSENIDLASGKTFKIGGTDVLTGSSLGSGITGSSLTSVGTLTNLTVSGNISTLTGLFRNGDNSTDYTKEQIRFGYSGSSTYQHYIHTRHNAGTPNYNAIDFYTSDGTPEGVFPTNAVFGMSIVGGNVGIGTSLPAAKLHVQGTYGYFADGTYNGYFGKGNGVVVGGGTADLGISSSTGAIVFGTGGSLTERMRLDASGNLGLGVTPSGWGAYKALDINTYGAIGSTSGALSILGNAYYNGTNYIYKQSSLATSYDQVTGQHRWSVAPSGAAGSAISFTQVMTLDASGNLGIGTPSPNSRLELSGTGATSSLYITNTTTSTGKTWKINSYNDGKLYVGIPNVVDALTVSSSSVTTDLPLDLAGGMVNKIDVDLGGTYNGSTYYTVCTTSTLPQSGVYVLVVYMDTWAVGGDHYYFYYSSIPFYWSSVHTNSDSIFTLPTMFGVGHADNGIPPPTIRIRLTFTGDGGNAYLEFSFDRTYSGIDQTSGKTIKFQLRRIA